MFAKTSGWLLFAGVLAFLGSAHANLRAPIESQPESSQALKPASPDLVVEYENLFFDLGLPYSGDAWTVQNQKRFAKVEAQYVVQSPREATYTFEFIMPQPNAAEVSINSDVVAAKTPERLPRDEKQQEQTDLWKVTFTGKLQQGQNTIRVSYQQPLGMSEVDYGYFKSSKWKSFVDYELWPLKEWKLGPDFRINIETTVDDDTFVIKRWFTSRHTVKALALVPEVNPDYTYWHEFEIGGGQVERADGKIKQRLVLGPKFPDRLRVISTEYIGRGFQPYVP